jgi:hypothetical protein
MWWSKPVIPLGRLRHDNCVFEASLDYIMRTCLKKKKKKEEKQQQK